MPDTNTPLSAFSLGALYATPGALAHAEEKGIDIRALLVRHRCGDWGNLCTADAVANERALAEDERVISWYGPTGDQIMIITEADRSATTVLLTGEY
jgi:hypothetical protein